MRRAALSLLWLSISCTDVVSVLTPPPDANEPDAGTGANGGGGGKGGTDTGGSDSSPEAGDGGVPSAGGGGESGAPSVEGVTADAGDAHACATRDGALYCWGSGRAASSGAETLRIAIDRYESAGARRGFERRAVLSTLRRRRER